MTGNGCNGISQEGLGSFLSRLISALSDTTHTTLSLPPTLPLSLSFSLSLSLSLSQTHTHTHTHTSALSATTASLGSKPFAHEKSRLASVQPQKKRSTPLKIANTHFILTLMRAHSIFIAHVGVGPLGLEVLPELCVTKCVAVVQSSLGAVPAPSVCVRVCVYVCARARAPSRTCPRKFRP